METNKIMYDLCRHYLIDRKATIPEFVYLRILGYLRSRNLPALAVCSDYLTHDVTGVEGARTLYQIEAFFKKNATFTDPVTAKLAALISFEEAEELCAATNRNLDDPIPENFRDLVERSKRFIDKVLGPFPEFLDFLPRNLKITSGATVSRSRRNALPHLKISRHVECTPGAWPLIQTLNQFFGYEMIKGAKLVSENRVCFVPKSWKTDRTIACEAEGNMPLQLAFDQYLKVRLRRSGINLSDQTRNQDLAREGSICDNLATIDLSQASDTLSYNTVCLLLPSKWHSYLRSIRSQGYEMYLGNVEQYHKFSSMGNGATFTLETLIFAAACYSLSPTTMSVYGDDIIIDSDKAERLMEYLAFLGFRPNTDKTYCEGPFRESCGKFWYKGFDITPRYIKELDDRKAVKCHFINSMMVISEPFGLLMDFLIDLAIEWKLPFVPFNDSSISGVWVHPYFAYSWKLIRTPKKSYFPTGEKLNAYREKGITSVRSPSAFIPMFKAFVPKSKVVRSMDWRSLVLWFLKNTDKDDAEPYESSWYTQSSHKYVRKWVHWKVPVVGSSDHLYWWSQQIDRKLGRTNPK